MIDLTPLEVRKKKGDFRKAMRGYEPQAVDDFIDLVADRLEQLVRDNAALNERMRSTETQISDYRERERALTEALVTAQEMREEMRRQMEREVEIKMREVEADVESMRSTAAHMREREEENVRRLRARQTQFVQSYRAFLERELAEIGVMAQTLDLSTHEDQSTTAPRKRARKAEPAASVVPPVSPPPAPEMVIPPAAPIAAAIAIPLVEVADIEIAAELPAAEVPVEEMMFEEEMIEPVRVTEPEPEPPIDDELIDLDAIFPPEPDPAADAAADAIEAAMFALDPPQEADAAPAPTNKSAPASGAQLDLNDVPFEEQEIPEIELIDEVDEEDGKDDEDADGWMSTLLEGKGE